jgi:enediyne biosynthesis protein E3
VIVRPGSIEGVASTGNSVLGRRAAARPASKRSGAIHALRARLIRIDSRETRFDVRGFAPCPVHVRRRLEFHGERFAQGFNSAVAASSAEELDVRLAAVDAAERGFAFEGAAMGLALLDLLVPVRARRLEPFLAGPARPHVYMAHVGAGWALARLRCRPWGGLPLDPLLRWLALDGYGFHEAFFHPRRTVRAGRRPRRLRGYELRAFDQGVGRALWFVDGADPDRIAATVATFARERRADLWSGVGLAAAYAGAVSHDGLRRLAELACPFAAHAAQGAAFAASARLRAGNLVPHTESACTVLCGVGAAAAAAVTDRALGAVEGGGTAEDYEGWRTEIRKALVAA